MGNKQGLSKVKKVPDCLKDGLPPQSNENSMDEQLANVNGLNIPAR
jgi:hypothetical protein